MVSGHASHQVGLDADIWLMPMPNRQLSRNEREEMSAVDMVAANRLDIDPKVRADQMGHTVDVNENVYTRTSVARRREAVNRLESMLRVV